MCPFEKVGEFSVVMHQVSERSWSEAVVMLSASSVHTGMGGGGGSWLAPPSPK